LPDDVDARAIHWAPDGLGGLLKGR
jgi:hypothetical protein